MQNQLPDDFIDLVSAGITDLSDARRALVNDVIPVGAAALWPFNNVAPGGNWIYADGSNVNRVTYSSLFAQYGTTFGVGDGVTTFGLPNWGNPTRAFSSPVWTSLTPQYVSGWQNYSPSVNTGFQTGAYWKDSNGIVHLRGLVNKTSAVTGGETIATLPSNHFPTALEVFMGWGAIGGSSTPQAHRIDVTAAGAINYNDTSGTVAGNYLSLAGIKFDSGVLPTPSSGEPVFIIKAM